MQPLRNWLLEVLCLLTVVFGFGMSLCAFAQIDSPAAPVLPIPIRVLEVKDGDTISADLLLPWGVTLSDQDVREQTYDAWEASKRRRSEAAGEITDAEVEKGKAATAALKHLLEDARVFLEPSNRKRQDQSKLGDKLGDRDNYGRVLGKLWVARGGKWIDIGAEMKRGGHLRGN
jgi:endonuclease YncB( thermonuclease family)